MYVFGRVSACLENFGFKKKKKISCRQKLNGRQERKNGKKTTYASKLFISVV